MYFVEMVVVSAAAAKNASNAITSFREPLAGSTPHPTAGSCARLATTDCTVAETLSKRFAGARVGLGTGECVRAYGLSPRGRGNLRRAMSYAQLRLGSIPRVRGNRLRLCTLRRCIGSIPACAGEPQT